MANTIVCYTKKVSRYPDVMRKQAIINVNRYVRANHCGIAKAAAVHGYTVSSLRRWAQQGYGKLIV